jgi:glycerol-3-phosphate acyltransferase PlsY
MRVFKVIVYFAFSYSLGAFNSAYILTLILYKKDIRNFGDGNAGTTNVFEHASKPLALLVFLIDLIKGALPIYFGNLLSFSEHAVALGGAFEILGHDFPVFFDFRGGTGITSLLGGIFAIDNNLALSLFIVFVVSFTVFSKLNVKFLKFRTIEQSEALSFIIAIIIIFGSRNILLKEYFFLSLAIIVYRHWRKALYVLSNVRTLKS